MLSIVIIIVLLNSVNSWNLTEYGFENDYYTSSIAIYRQRAFLALPRTVYNQDTTKPTLVEVSWSENTFGLSNLLDPFRLRKIPTNWQSWGNCKHLQNAISVVVEPLKPTLWILDRGTQKCAPKLISYSLFLNSIHQSIDFTGIGGGNLNTFIIDPQIGDHGLRGYIGDAGNNILIVVSLQDLKWWKLKLIEKSEPYMSISASFLAISKTTPSLYITGWNSTEIFELNLKQIREDESPLAIEANEILIETNVTYLGNKLGKSRGLETDYKSGLSYYLIRDFAITRWETDKPSIAEYHSILAQSYAKLPYVSQLFTGPQLGLWALVNPCDPDRCQPMKQNENKGNVTNRVVKLLKYNNLFM